MKTNPNEKKLPGWTGSFLVLKLLFLLIVVPVSIPLAGVFVQTLVWRYLLCRIEGISFSGGALEAFALFLALGAFAACINLLVTVIIDGGKKLRHIPLEKLGQRKAPEIASWAEMYKVMPGFRPLLQHFVVNAMALAFLSHLQPLRFGFDGVPQLLLAAGVLSASWIFCMAIFSVAVHTYIIREQKARAAAVQAVSDKAVV